MFLASCVLHAFVSSKRQCRYLPFLVSLPIGSLMYPFSKPTCGNLPKFLILVPDWLANPFSIVFKPMSILGSGHFLYPYIVDP